jgi:Protein of unknown function (DUF3108)
MTAKRLLAALLVCTLLVLAGIFVYLRWTRKAGPPPKVASNWPAIEPSKPPERPKVAPPIISEIPAPPEQPAKKEAPAEPGFVLRQGETLEYNANLPKLNSTVADLKIVAAERRNTGGKGSWHLQAFAHTENPYRMVFELDDEFDSYSEAGNMTGVQYEMHLSERGQKVDNVERLLSSPEEPAPSGTSAARVLPGTRDPLGMLEYLRGVDWSKTSEVHSPVYDGRKLYEVRAVLVEKSDAVSVPAGKFKAMKIEIHVMDNGVESKDTHFLLYLTDDSARLPVLMEAVLPVATARVELAKAK